MTTLAKVVQQNPDHFAGFAAVPLVNPKAGVDEFERAVTQLGFKGALINGQTNGHYPGDDQYSVFWERVQALELPIYLHASDPLVPPATYEGCPQLTGAGKTHLLTGLCFPACRQKRRVRFATVAALVNELVEAKQQLHLRRVLLRRH